MLWDVWIVDEDNVTKLLVSEVTPKQWRKIKRRSLGVVLFRVPSGFLSNAIRFLDDCLQVN
jgi:hypothetical protein